MTQKAKATPVRIEMRISPKKLKQLTDAAIKQKHLADQAARARLKADRAAEESKQDNRDRAKARQLLKEVERKARQAAEIGHQRCRVLILGDGDFNAPGGVDELVADCLLGSARYVYQALAARGFDTHIAGGHIDISW